MGKEVWKVIPEFDLYEVSNYGNVRCKERMMTTGVATFVKKGRFIKGSDNGSGYKKVQLKQDGNTKKEYIHRLVANAFIENPENKQFVNHIDNNPSNNRVENLEWCTPQENHDWMRKQKRDKRTRQWIERLHKAQEKQYVSVIGENIETGEKIKFKNINSVKAKGFQPSCVCNCCQGKLKQHKGYRWFYEKYNSR